MKSEVRGKKKNDHREDPLARAYADREQIPRRRYRHHKIDFTVFVLRCSYVKKKKQQTSGERYADRIQSRRTNERVR